MCCFSRRVEKVSDTNIFARASKDGRQFLAYSMFMAAKQELAMILPLPTPKSPAEDAVKFINLEAYPTLFVDMHRAFVPPPPRGYGRAKDAAPLPKAKLEVVKVGSFVASFVPTIKDFARLDEQFRLPPATWDELPVYKEFSFAVFKLQSGEKKIHPMAFEFPRADAKKLFFPTVHIHDGKIHKTAEFDHTLYCQVAAGENMMRWTESKQHAGMHVRAAKTEGIVDPDRHLYRLVLKGRKTNQDTYLA